MPDLDMDSPVAKAFWSEAHKCAPTECWPWLGKSLAKYGRFDYAGSQRYAHRVAWSLRHGEIPNGAVIRHTCDNPLCVNPDHLDIGSQHDNVQDIYARGRWSHRRGSGHGRALLGEDDARAIFVDPRPSRELAEIYGVAEGTISNIRSGRTWKHVTHGLKATFTPKSQVPRVFIPPSQEASDDDIDTAFRRAFELMATRGHLSRHGKRAIQHPKTGQTIEYRFSISGLIFD